jgi:hypothetical protein
VRTPRLIRSGWWVAVAGIAVSILVVIGVMRSTTRPGPERSDVAPIVLEPCVVDPGEIVQAMARDGLKALVDPANMTPEAVRLHNENERGKLLVSSDLVVGVFIGGEARAYPLRLLRWHEAVNDSLGGRSIAVTYSPLSGAVAVWDRVLDGEVLELAVSGRLLDSNTLLYDRRPVGGISCLWHQLSGEALSGPAVGQALSPLPAALQTWGEWLSAHPETTVIAPDGETKRLYKRDPYHSYRGSDVLRFPVSPEPPSGPLALKDRVAVVRFPSGDIAFALRDLAEAVGAPRGSWATLHDRQVYLVDFDTEAGSFAIAPRDEGVPTPSVRFAYWFQWYCLHPDAVTLP